MSNVAVPHSVSINDLPATCGGLFSDAEWDAIRAELNLSPRESQILCGVFDDLSESGIASKLGISVHTVHTYFERLYRKVGVSSRPALLVRVFETYLDLLRGAA